MNAAERGKLQADLRAVGLTEPVRILPHIPTMDEVRATFKSRYVIQQLSQTLWLFENAKGQVRCKVQRKANDAVTGSCGAFQKNREGSCPHIGEYCIFNGLDIPGGGFQTARRLEPAVVIAPTGKATATLRNRAYREMGGRIRQLAFSLCDPIEGVLPPWPFLTKRRKGPKKAKTKAGRPPIPLKVIVYAAIVKTAFGLSYYELQDVLKNDEQFAKFSCDPPNLNSMSDALAHPHVLKTVEGLLGQSARTGRNIDFIVALDGTGMGTTMNQRWLNLKDDERHSESPPDSDSSTAIGDSVAETRPKKKRKPFIKVHTLMGLVSGLIYAIDCTVHYGEGTADIKHFKPLLERASPNCNFTAIAADKGYYSAANYAFCDRRDWLLFVWKKKGTSIQNVGEGREMLAFLDWLKREHYHVFVRFYRLRPLVEAVFSSQKRQTGHIKLRIRRWEYERLAVLEYPPKLPDSAPETFQIGRDEICRYVSMEHVGYAQRIEAHLKALGSNLRAIVRLENEYRDRIDLTVDQAFIPMRRISLPMVS
jgi:hypothetical protein